MPDPATTRDACRKRIYRNQARHFERKFPRLRSLGIEVSDDNAEMVCTVYGEHIKHSDPAAAEIDLAAMYRTVLESPAAGALHPQARRWLARHLISHGLTGRARAVCSDSDIGEEIAAIEACHNAGYGADVSPYLAVKSTDRGASLVHYFAHHETLLENKVVGHIAPEAALRAWFHEHKSRLPCGYVMIDGFQNGMDAYVDLVETLLPAGMFDVLICHRVLEHVLDDSAALREMLRILKPGGILNISVPQNFAFAQNIDWSVPDPAVHGHVRTYGADFQDQLAAAGFEVTAERWLLERPMDELMARKAFPLLMYNARKPAKNDRAG
jgi:SAM-dependent methyltransferase